MWISLVGFMGCGKTSVARVLSDLTFLPIRDLDAEVARTAGMSVGEIFAREGEASFRAREADVLRRVPTDGELIVDCGGGIVEDPAARAKLRRCGTVIWIDAPWETLRRRIERDPKERPLRELMGWDGMAGLYRRRTPLYAVCAHFRVRSDWGDAETVARRALACCLRAEGVMLREDP